MSFSFGGLAALAGVFLTGLSFLSSKKVSDSSQRADEERRKASAVQKKINEVKLFREKIAAIAQGRKERAAALSRQTVSGSSGGSSRGKVGGISSTVGSNFDFQTRLGALTNEASANLFQASIFDSQASSARADATFFQSAGLFASKAPQIKTTIGTIFDRTA